jgi:hypothetical protein
MIGIKHLIAVLAFLYLSIASIAQKDLLQGINLGSQLGFSGLATELPKDFSGMINEFDNQAGLSYTLELSKYVSPYWEAGTGLNSSLLQGYAENPELSAEGVYTPGIISIGEIDEPLKYKNQLTGQDFFVRCFFKNVADQNHFNINPFLKFGGGYINYKSELTYATSAEIVPGTRKDHLKLTTGLLKLGTGFKAFISGRLQLITSLDFCFVDYDYLDVVHNFTEEGKRQGVIGIYAEWKVGLYFNVTRFEAGKGRSKKFATPEYLPFSNL